MIHELKQEAFFKINKLLNDPKINLEIKSVVEQFSPGWIFVDDLTTPSTALVWSKGICGFYFIGDANNTNFNNELNVYIDEVIKPRALELELSEFEFSGTSEAWDKSIKKIFVNRKMNIKKQMIYKNPQTKEKTSTLDTSLSNEQLLKIDNCLLENKTIDTTLIDESILEWWTSKVKFLKEGLF